MVPNLEERTESMLVVGRRATLRNGPIFNQVEDLFLAVMRPRDGTGTSYVLPVSEETYQQHRLGDSIDVTQYSKNGRNWYFSSEEAENYTPIMVGVVFGRD